MTETAETPIRESATVTPYGEVSRMAVIVHRTATVNDEVLFEARYDDTDVVYRSITLSAADHEAVGAPDRLTVTVEPGDRLNVDEVDPDAEPAPDPLVLEVAAVLNRHSRENASNTPDFVLAGVMVDALAAFERASKAREAWYGQSLTIGGSA